MRTRNFASLAAIIAVGSLLAGCSGNTAPGTPLPATSTSAGKPDTGAPAVPRPLDTKSIEAAPCDAVTAAQVASLGSPQKSATSKPSEPLGPACTWRFATEHPSSVTGTVFTADHSGVAGIYAKQQSGGFTDFRPFTTNGYPGAIYANSDHPLAGECALAVGVRDDLTYAISVSLDSANTPLGDPCEVGKKVAGFVLEHLQKG
jgi:hypothetical protein